MEDKPTLQSLPAELLEMVAEYNESSDLCALRLVCRKLEAKVLRTFREVHFTLLGVLLYDSSSLDLAIEIAKHPIFGPQVQGIALYLDVVDSTMKISEDTYGAGESDEDDGVDEDDASDYSGETKDSIEALEPPWDRFSWSHVYELTRAIRRGEDDFGAFREPQSTSSQKLVELFKLLKGHNSLTGLAIMTCNGNEDGPLRLLSRSPASLTQLSPKSISWSKSIELVLEALVHTDLNSIEQLIFLTGEPDAIPIHVLTPRITSMLAWTINRLKKLCISTASEFPVVFAKHEKPLYEALASMLREAVSYGLAKICIRDCRRISATGWTKGSRMFECFKEMHMPGLQTLQIDSVHIRYASDLVNCAARCPDLKRLRLRDCRVDSHLEAREESESLQDVLERLTKVAIVEVDEDTEATFA